ncbi:MAG: PASTA domain-containing protein [Flavobacteriaceae bacterium]|jgi:serine/threonine-protein kinase|nr:PASTA domain-containing protein [Flavobacteriaceae bacterium]
MLKSFLNWKVLLNLLLAIGVFIGLVWLTFRWLEIRTHHGQEIPVPNVVNLSVQDAMKVLDESGLEYEIDSPRYDPKYRPLQVLKMWPSAGSRIKGSRTVQLIINPKNWAKVSVPDILDRYKNLAFRQLDQVGLKVGDTLYEPSIQRDAVLRMIYNGTTLKPGTLLPRFSTIDLVIGSGPKRDINVPNVVGLTVQEAKAVISQNLFEIGLVEHEDGGKDESDIVYYQDPAAFSIRDQGMQIDIWASKKTPAEMSVKIENLNSQHRVKIDTTAVYTIWDDDNPTPPSDAPPKNSSGNPSNSSDQKPKDDPKPKKTTVKVD